MNDATQTILALAGSIVGSIVFLTLFFKLLRYFDSKSTTNTERVKLRGVIDENSRVTIHLSNGTVFEDVILVGFTQADNMKQAFPYELSGMSILEHQGGSKTVIQSKLIRMIDVPSAKSDANQMA